MGKRRKSSDTERFNKVIDDTINGFFKAAIFLIIAIILVVMLLD